MSAPLLRLAFLGARSVPTLIRSPSTLQGISYVVGQIHTDSDGKLNDSSVHLQASRSMGAGSRTLLKFIPNVLVRGGAPGIAGTGLFRGAILGFKGKNGGGGCFLVEEILVVSLLRGRDERERCPN